MLNLQELQTIEHHCMPIAIFVFENCGYKTMQITQRNHFKRDSASSIASGFSCADFERIAFAFGIITGGAKTSVSETAKTLVQGKTGPAIRVLTMDLEHALMPRVQTRTENGKFLPADISDMWPHLEREEYARNMQVGSKKQSDAA